MIHKNKKYGSVKCYSFLEFGKGDIKVVDALGEGHVSVLFRNDSVHAIGENDPTTGGISSDEFNPNVVMAFDNPDSIDVVIDFLLKAKKALVR